MKKEIADRWVEALRSGKYNQSKSALKKDDGFCCLGVLCDISGVGKWTKVMDHRGEVQEEKQYSGRINFLPDDVRFWSGIKSSDGMYETGNLANDNDKGASFESIACVIEKNWERL